MASQTISTAQRRAGPGTSACRHGAASATSTRAAIAARRRRGRAAALYRAAAQGPAGPQDPDPRGPSRDVLEEQLRRGRAWRRLSRAAGILGHRAGRAVRQADRRADAGVPRGHGHRRQALQRRDEVSLGPDHRFPEAALCAHEAHRQPFWRDNVDPATVPERLQDLLQLWKYQPPWFFDEFDRLEEVFPAASYQYVLYGMGFRSEVDPEEMPTPNCSPRGFCTRISAVTGEMRARLPKNRELLQQDLRVRPAARLKRTHRMTHIVPLNKETHRSLHVDGARVGAPTATTSASCTVIVKEFPQLVVALSDLLLQGSGDRRVLLRGHARLR